LPGEATNWPRSRVLIEVGKQFPIGRRADVMFVGGLALTDRAAWQVAENGNLVLA